MVAHLPPWLPTEKAVGVKEAGDAASEEGEKKAEPTTTSFLSLAGLNLDLVLENGARLYSADLREFAKDKQNPSKRAKRTSSYTDGKGESPAPFAQHFLAARNVGRNQTRLFSALLS